MEKKKRSPEEIQRIKEKVKKGAIIALPIAFALIAAISMALLVGGMNKANENEEPDDQVESSTPSDVQVIVPGGDKGEEKYSQGLEFRSNSDGTCEVVGIGSCSDRIVRISDRSPSGDRVVGIGDRAFMGESGIDEIVLPNSLMRIGKEAFKGSGITVISIPSSVVSIGEMAFARCVSLSAINVNGANPMFASDEGVLFDREMETLICYPSGKTGSTYTIPKSVTKISASAFSSCTYLVNVKYGGTKKQWKDVYVASGNDSLDTSNMSFAPEEK